MECFLGKTLLQPRGRATRLEKAKRKPLIIAHRGASHEAPENTLSAINRGFLLGSDGVEVDLQLTSDDKIAVFHDEMTGRTCKKCGPLFNIPSKMLFQMDAGSWFSKEFKGEKIPSLDDILKLKRKGFFILEIKSSEKQAFETAVLVLSRLKNQKKIILSSFSPFVLETLQALSCPHPLFAIAANIKQLKNFGPVDGYALHYRLAKNPLAQKLLATSTLFYWTVDSKKIALSLIGKAHGLITNNPRLMLGMKEFSKNISSLRLKKKESHLR